MAGGYRLLVFDFDGTLADSFGWFLANINRAAAAHGFTPMDLTRIDDYRGLHGRELMARLGLPLWKVPAVTASMRRAMGADIATIRPFDGVDRMLRGLRDRGIGTALVTSNSRHNVERVLGADTAALLDHVACGASMFGKRPLLRRVARAAGVPHPQVLCIGDELRDADAAEALGMHFAAVSWGYATEAALAPRSVCPPFRSMASILEAV